MEKNAMVAIIQARNISKKPTSTMVNMAPKNRRVPAVSNKCSPDFSERALKAFLRFIAANR